MNYTVFAILGIFVVSIFTMSNLVSAETVAKSTAFEKTTLLEFTNNDPVPIHSVKMWLGKDSGTFKSFKAEKGWTGMKTPQGVIVFSSSEPLVSGQSVKFGIKTEVASPGINWRTIDSAGNEISIGKVIPGEIKQTETQPPIDQKPKENTPGQQTTMESASFKIIPESPKRGDSIRVVGEGFPPNTELDFLIDNQVLGDFGTDNGGHVVGRTKIPLTLQSDRVELSLDDRHGHRKTISIRIGQAEESTITNPKKLTVDKADSIAEPGQTVRASGTGRPGSSVTITAKNPEGIKIYEAVVEVDNQGNWSHETTIPLDAPIGTRQVEFSDGIDTITKTLSISITKTINITPSATKYNPGDKFVFNGTAKPDQSLQIIINDPIGKEIFSDIFELNGTNQVKFEYQTTQTSPKGTYVVFATQGDETQIVRVGLGQLPSPQLFAKFDKLNYASSDTAKITIQGPAKSTVSILIIDPSDKPKLTESVTLGLDGSKVYDLKLDGYKSGVYTAVVKQPQSQAKLVFAVGLQTTGGKIAVQTTKPEYLPGEGILVLGSTSPNAILNLEMSDPNGKIIKQKDIFSDKEGKFSEGTFRIPSDGNQGTWTIRAKSGANYADVKFTVSGTIVKTFSVRVDKTAPYHGGDIMTITGIGGGKTQTVVIKISDSKNNQITELTMSSTKEGSFQTLWQIPTGMEPGKYNVKATVGTETAETTFDLQ
ncbi:MAG: biofilm-associated protein [Candidatus Nitrosotenuis sp.]